MRARSSSLAWGDVAVDGACNPRMVQCHLKQSKTDQLDQGVDVVLGRTGLDLCPQRNMQVTVFGSGRPHRPPLQV